MIQYQRSTAQRHLICDGPCGRLFDSIDADPALGDARLLRDRAREAGWTQRRGHDLCPECRTARLAVR